MTDRQKEAIQYIAEAQATLSKAMAAVLCGLQPGETLKEASRAIRKAEEVSPYGWDSWS